MSEDLTDDAYEVSSIASIFNSPSEQEEESLEDVFQTITPTSPTQTRLTSLSIPSTVNCSTIPNCSTPRELMPLLRTSLTAVEVGPVRTPCTSFTDTEDESEIGEINERKCKPKVDKFQVSRSEEEEQEDEKKERGDATPDDSHLTVHV